MTNLTHQVKARAKRRGWAARMLRWLQKRVGFIWRDSQWLLMAVLWVCALGLGYAGLGAYMRGSARPASSLDIVYLALQLVTLESGAIVGPIPWQLEIARFSLPALAAWTAIRALALVFHEQTQRIVLRFMRGHVVICGLSQMGLLLAAQFLARKERVVLLVQDEGNPLIETCRSSGAIVIIGDLMDPHLLRQTALPRARLLIAVSDDDGVNAGVAALAQEVRGLNRGKPLPCIVHIVEPRLYDLLRENVILNQRFPSLRLMPFNVYEHGARVMVEQADPGGAAFLSDGRSCRVLIVGLGKLGENVLLHIARLWFDEKGKGGQRLQIDVIDADAEAKIATLHARHPHLSSACRVKPWTMRFESPEYLQAHFLKDDSGSGGLGAVFVCVDNDTTGLYAGLALHKELRQEQIPIIIRMRQQSGLAMLLAQNDNNHPPYANVHAFDLYARTCTPEILLGGTHERLAQAFYREYVRQMHRSGKREMEPQARTWRYLSEEEREANRRQVDRVGVILDSAGYDLVPQRDWGALPHQFAPDEIERMACMEHERWRCWFPGSACRKWRRRRIAALCESCLSCWHAWAMRWKSE